MNHSPTLPPLGRKVEQPPKWSGWTLQRHRLDGYSVWVHTNGRMAIVRYGEPPDETPNAKVAA